MKVSGVSVQVSAQPLVAKRPAWSNRKLWKSE